MARTRYFDSTIRALAATAAFAFMAGVGSGPVWAQDGIEPEAAKILKSMTDFLGAAETFSASYDSDHEIVTRSGQKLEFSASGKLEVERPGKFHAVRDGTLTSAEIFVDAGTVTVFDKTDNAYAQLSAPDNGIDGAIDEIRMETGLDISGADLLYSNAYEGLTTDAESGRLIGSAYVEGRETHHLAFRAKDVDWQIWIEDGDKPVPLKYVITSKWVTGAPQFTVVMSDWNIGQKIDPATFVFSPPEGATKLDSLRTDETGEIASEAE